MRRIRRRNIVEAELDITAFMNLMIVLVPVLLLGMVFSQITVIDVDLPPAATSSDVPEEQKQVELVLTNDLMQVNYPKGTAVKRIAKTEAGDHDFELLSLTLQELKRQLLEQGIERDNITILASADADYQTIISTMDTVRSYKALLITDVVDAVLFPNISFGDAPIAEGESS